MRINDPNLLQQVVKYLDKHQEAVRIKKMLYCLCTSRWEKDTDYLDSINFQYLIEQIVREHGTLEQFRVLLQNLVKTVNKPKQYIAIAKIIYLAIGQLYPEFNQEHGVKVAPPAREPVSATAAEIPPTNSSVASAFQRAYAPEPSNIEHNNGVPSSLERAYMPLSTQAPIDDDVDESAYETYCAPDLSEEEFAANGTDPAEATAVPDYDPFALRQNVMSCTNPLRAKIILLIMLRPDFNFSSQSVALMRDYQLDDLLLEIFKAYPTVSQMEEGLTFAVEQLVEVEEYGKAASGLLQSLVPLYQ
jgi:hypothetical protein